ncbi:MAG: DUF3604 domain-containing protein [Chlamydiales bacterium]|nr:DUF3604 domain-containing protein [Chlamydiales bacterium]
MRRSIAYTEPAVATAGEKGTWKFIYTTASSLPKGTKCKFDLMSNGRDIEWEVPSSDPKRKSNLIWMELPNGKSLAPASLQSKEALTPHFEFTLPDDIKAGESLAIFLGSQSDDPIKGGSRAQQYVYRRRPFNLFIDTKGKGNYKEPEVFTLDVRGGPLHTLRVISPSVVTKNQRFDIVVRFEDQYGNLTSNAPEGMLVELSYEKLRNNLSWKLFVPETGFIALPNLYFSEAGLYRLELNNPDAKQKYYSSPIKCFDQDVTSIYWGTFHGESSRVDTGENIETALRHFRDDHAMQFYGTSSFESDSETPNEIWKLICNQVAEFNEEDRFVTYLGFQWAGSEGVRQILHLKDNKPLLKSKDSKSNQLKKIYKLFTQKDLIAIPSFTMAKGYVCDFKEFDPEHEPVVEIYNSWGCSECTEKEGNLRPIKATSKKGISEDPAGSIRDALNRNCRFGFVAGGLDDRGIYADFYHSDQIQYSPGITAVMAGAQSRDSIISALHRRATYATTGARMILGMQIANRPIGSELNTEAKPGLVYNRHITGYVAGTAPIQEIQIIRNGEIFHTYNPHEPSFEIELDDSEPIEKIALKSPDNRPNFVYYYMRVIQEDGHMGWTSPIWIDLAAPEATTPVKKPRKK